MVLLGQLLTRLMLKKMGTGGVGGADDRPQIVWVAELVADHDEGGLTPLPGNIQDVVHSGIFPHGGQGDDPLVGMGAAHAVQLPAVGVHYHNALLPGGGGDVSQGGICVPLHEKDLVDGYAGPQGLGDRIAAFNDAVVFRLHRGGAAQRGSFVHGAVLPSVVPVCIIT